MKDNNGMLELRQSSRLHDNVTLLLLFHDQKDLNATLPRHYSIYLIRAGLANHFLCNT